MTPSKSNSSSLNSNNVLNSGVEQHHFKENYRPPPAQDSLSRPPTPLSEERVADLAMPVPPKPQAQGLIAGPSPVFQVSPQHGLVSSSTLQPFTETYQQVGQTQTSQAPRQDSTTSTVWRASLVHSANLTLSDLVRLPDEGSVDTPMAALADPPDSRRHARPLSFDLIQQADTTAKLSSHSTAQPQTTDPSSLDDKLDQPLLIGTPINSLSPEKITSSTATQLPAPFKPPNDNALATAASLPNDQDLRRQSALEGLNSLRENFSRFQEEMTSSSSPCKKPISSSPSCDPNLRQKDPGGLSSHFNSPLRPGRDSKVSKLSPGNTDWDFWGSVMNDYELVAREHPKQLSRAIQSGIPPALRGMMWQLMSSSKDPELELVYSQLLSQPCSHEKAISRDVSRTYPQIEYFQEGGLGQDSLLAVCKAFSLYDPEVGYTQGLQFIIGPMLLNMPDEEAFCVLVRLMNSYDLRSHFVPNMPGLQLRLFQFDRILEDLLPHVYMHLLRQGIKSSMYASQWFLTLFGYRFPLELVSVVMDLVFAEGLEAVFRFALCLMKKNETQICALGFDKVLDFLKLSLFEPYKNHEKHISSSASDHNRDLKEDPPTAQSPLPEPLPAVTTTPENTSSNPPDSCYYPIRTPGSTHTYRAHDFIKDALQIKITPIMLDQYASEWDSICKERNAHSIEIERLRMINSQLSNQVKRLESNLAQANEEHCDLVKQVVMAKLEKEELEEELVKYKMAFADLSHQQATEGTRQHRASSVSTHHSHSRFQSSAGTSILSNVN